MAITLQEVERDARRLSPEEREHLVGCLLSSLDDEPLSDVDQSWLRAAEVRRQELQEGRVAGIPAAEALAAVRHQLDKLR